MRSLKVILALILFVLVTTIYIFSDDFKVRVTASKANIRLRPNTQSAIVSTVPLGAILEIIKKEGNWYFVKLPPDEKGIVVTGYIHQSIVEVVEEIKEIPKEEKVEERKPPEVTPARVVRTENVRDTEKKTAYEKRITPAKPIDFRIGGGIVIPTGDFGKFYSLGFGGGASIIYSIYKQIDLVGGIDFFYFPAKDVDGRMIRVIPNVCGRYNLSSNIGPAFFGEIGLGVYYDNAKVYISESETVIGFKFGGGFTYKKIEFLAEYQIASHERDAHNAFVISILYRL